jgi:hypothetical protein
MKILLARASGLAEMVANCEPYMVVSCAKVEK